MKTPLENGSNRTKRKIPRWVKFIGTTGLAMGLWTGALSHHLQLYRLQASSGQLYRLAARQHEEQGRQSMEDAIAHYCIAQKFPTHADKVHEWMGAYFTAPHHPPTDSEGQPQRMNLNHAPNSQALLDVLERLNAEEAKHPEYSVYRKLARKRLPEFWDFINNHFWNGTVRQYIVERDELTRAGRLADYDIRNVAELAHSWHLGQARFKGANTNARDFGYGFGIGAAGGVGLASAYWALMKRQKRKYDHARRGAPDEHPRTRWFWDWFGYNRDFRE